MIDHYTKLNINYQDKSFIYSDSINSIEMAQSIVKDARENKITRHTLGIGTWFTNDINDTNTPLNHVIKLDQVKINRQDPEYYNVVKISDSPGKEIGDEDEIKLAKLTLKIK
jgi:hypothetical protein